MRRKLIIIFCLAVTVFIFNGNVVEAQVPEIIHSIPRISGGYGGGVTTYPLNEDFKIYETTNESGSGAQYIDIKSPVDGAVEGRIKGVYTGHKDITYDSKRNIFWATTKGGPIVAIPVTGGGYAALVDLKYEYGIFYDSELDCLWVGGGSIPQIWRVDPETGYVLETINIDHGMGSKYSAPAGVVKVGENFWIGVAGEYGTSTDKKAWVVELDRQGVYTGRRLQLPEAGYSHDIGGFALDPNGYLWVKGGKYTRVYQIDIGYEPVTPTPAPSPTPIYSSAPIIDSGDYNGDGTSDIAIFRGSSGLWSVRGITRLYYGREADIPVPGDYNGDGTTDPGIYRNTTGFWGIRGITRTYYGAAEDIPVPGDYDGDGSCDISLFRGSSGLWAVKSITRAYFGGAEDIPVPLYYGDRAAKYMAIYRPSSGLWSIRGLGRAYFGGPSDQPVPANYDGSAGGTDIGIFRDANGLWAIRGVTRVYFGRSGDQPVPGSYRGGDTADMGIFRRSTGLWVIRNLGRAYFGGSNDIPVSGRVPSPPLDRPLVYSSDYNGDGTDDVAIFRPSTGLWAIRGISRIYFGQSGDSPTPGDYTGDGTTRISIYRSQGSIWKVRNLTQVSFGSELSGEPVPADYTGDGICDMAFFDDGLWTVRIQFPVPDIIEAIFGQTGDQPVPGNYGGTESADLAIFRPSTGLWAVKGLTRFYFGRDGDIGMPADYTGDGLIDPAIYRPDSGEWIVRNITTVDFGYQNGVIPVSADFNGDGRDGMGLFRPSYGIWQIHDYGWFYFGGPDDLPVSGLSDVDIR